MDLTRSLDIYCERLGPGYWAEPLNAVTNAAFLIAAVVMWRRTAGLPLGRLLSAILAAIGVGSYLWHTHGQVWAVILDSGSIAVFSLVFLFAANRDFLGLRPLAALGLTLLYFPYTALTGAVFGALPFFAISAEYWGLPLLMAVYAVVLRRSHPATAKGLWAAAALLCLSLTFRSLDTPLCPLLPVGTHFLWHLLNGLLLGGMIELYRRHVLAARGPVAVAGAGR